MGRPLALLLVFGLGASACIIEEVVVEPVKVVWSIDDSKTPGKPAQCTKYGIATWRVATATGEFSHDVPCSNGWEVGDELEEGHYTFTITAYDSANKEVGGTSADAEISASDAQSPDVIEITLTPSELNGSSSGAQIEVSWNINDTIDGKEFSKSWDTCDEVGAKYVSITYGGKNKKVDCAQGGDMKTKLTDVNDGQSYSVGVTLQDASGNDLTTTSSGKVKASSSATYVADFMYNSFKGAKADLKGNYHFKLTYDGGKTCNQTSPNVLWQIALVKMESGAAVTGAKVCDLNKSWCADADGATGASCFAGEQFVSPLKWGYYRLTLEGAVAQQASPNICWEAKEKNMLVGAGTKNPSVTIDAPRLSGVTCK